MTALIACPSCSAHVRTTESSCPHCDARISSEPGHPVLRTTGAVLMGLSLSACIISSSPDYGVADTGDISSGGGETSSSSTGGTDTGSSSGEASSGAASSSGSGSSGSSSGGSDSSSSGGSSTTTLGGPDYGVPETTWE